MDLRWLIVLAMVGCGSDMKRHTRAFVAPTTCGQGPYDIHLRADGMTGGDGVEVIACTPRRIAGHVVFRVAGYELANRSFGSGADNQRCLGGQPTTTVVAGTGDASATAGSGSAAAPGAPTAAPVLVERPFTGSETPSADKLCGDLGLQAQEVLGAVILMRTDANDTFLPRGGDLHVRLWSDVPNDLEGVVFMVRHLTSTKTPAEVKAEEDKRPRDRDDRVEPLAPRRTAGHGPPPPPLVEEQPPRPVATATWVPGYWSWTGTAWGWVAGFWRDDRLALPAPRVEVPGAPPRAGAIWIGGTWTLRAGQFVWIRGRWRL